MEMQRAQNIQSNLENKRNLENLTTYYKITVIKTGRYWLKDLQTSVTE